MVNVASNKVHDTPSQWFAISSDMRASKLHFIKEKHNLV